MSYYDNVALALYKEDFEMLNKAVAKWSSINNAYNYNVLESAVIFEHSDDIVVLSWEDFNHWGDHDEEVFVMSFIRDKDIAYHLWRIGEDYNDFEEEHWNDDDWILGDVVSYRRYLDIDGRISSLSDFDTTTPEPENEIKEPSISFDDVIGGI